MDASLEAHFTSKGHFTFRNAEHLVQKSGAPGGYSGRCPEYPHALRLVSKLPDLRAANANHEKIPKIGFGRPRKRGLPPSLARI